MSHPHVPKFGEWAAGANSYPYTVCFDKARKDRAGEKPDTQNDPQIKGTRNLPPYGESKFQPPQPGVRHHQEHKIRPDNNGDHSQSGSNHSSKSGKSRRTRHESYGGDNLTSSHGQSSPAAEHVRVKNSSKDTVSRKGSHDKGNSCGATANRVRHSSMGDEQGRVVHALPKFGQWDVNPASSDGGYTQVFNLVREEKKNIAKSPLHIQVDHQPINSVRRKSSGFSVQTSSCCFPWSKRVSSDDL